MWLVRVRTARLLSAALITITLLLILTTRVTYRRHHSGPSSHNKGDPNNNNDDGDDENVGVNQSYDPAVAWSGLHYCKAAYCPSSSLVNWSCGAACAEHSQFELYRIYENITQGTSGYTGVDTAARQIVIAFRGSYNTANWIEDLTYWAMSYPSLACGRRCQVHRGFYRAYLSLRASVMSDVYTLHQTYPHYSIFVTGHSLGGSIALFCALDLAMWSYPEHSDGKNATGQQDYAFVTTSDKGGHEPSSPSARTAVRHARGARKALTQHRVHAHSDDDNKDTDTDDAAGEMQCTERVTQYANDRRETVRSATQTCRKSQVSASTETGHTHRVSDACAQLRSGKSSRDERRTRTRAGVSAAGEYRETHTSHRHSSRSLIRNTTTNTNNSDNTNHTRKETTRCNISSYALAPLTVYTFGEPRVGNGAFSSWVVQVLSCQRQFRITHARDVVPHLPPRSFGYVHVPQELWYVDKSVKSEEVVAAAKADSHVTEDEEEEHRNDANAREGKGGQVVHHLPALTAMRLDGRARASESVSVYTECADSAVVEDANCSAGVWVTNVADHLFYLGVCTRCHCDADVMAQLASYRPSPRLQAVLEDELRRS